jgi:hypothetical protein
VFKNSSDITHYHPFPEVFSPVFTCSCFLSEFVAILFPQIHTSPMMTKQEEMNASGPNNASFKTVATKAWKFVCRQLPRKRCYMQRNYFAHYANKKFISGDN